MTIYNNYIVVVRLLELLDFFSKYKMDTVAKNKLSKSKLYIITFLLLFVVITGFAVAISRSYKFSQSKKQVQLLTQIDNPIEFAVGFDFKTGRPVNLEVEGWQNLIWRSSIYPYNKLKRVFIGGDQGCRAGSYNESRYLQMDTQWNIFWVEISVCYEKPKFFGPFLTNNITNIN